MLLRKLRKSAKQAPNLLQPEPALAALHKVLLLLEAKAANGLQRQHPQEIR